jgi:hypothetical protein
MLNNIRDLGLDISINNILYGNSDFAHDVNCSPPFKLLQFCLKRVCRILARREPNEKYLGGFTGLL